MAFFFINISLLILCDMAIYAIICNSRSDILNALFCMNGLYVLILNPKERAKMF